VLVSDPAVLVKLTFDRVLYRLAGAEGHAMYQAFARSFMLRDPSDATPGPRCDDEGPAASGAAPLNGFPVPCPAEAANFAASNESKVWKPLSVTNRFDLAPRGGENCGEQHLSFVFDRSGSGLPEFPVHAALRFSAVIDNPAPDRGLEGCRPLVDFWASQSRAELDDPSARAEAFEAAFLGTSLAAKASLPSPEVEAMLAAGFPPFISAEHFGNAGRLQLLYLGDEGHYFFYEHALVSAAEGWVRRRPLSQGLPVSSLLSQDPTLNPCAQSLLSAIPGLLDDDLTKLRVNVAPSCFVGAASEQDPTLTAGLRGWVSSGAHGPTLATLIDQTLSLSYPERGLSYNDIGVRADFAGTCVGCHHLKDSPLANPGSMEHVNAGRTEPCGSGVDASRSCYARSPLLKYEFLPRWRDVLQNFWENPGAFGPLPNGAASTTAIDGAPLVQQNP
jgi:hypothetical protein